MSQLENMSQLGDSYKKIQKRNNYVFQNSVSPADDFYSPFLFTYVRLYLRPNIYVFIYPKQILFLQFFCRKYQSHVNLGPQK